MTGLPQKDSELSQNLEKGDAVALRRRHRGTHLAGQEAEVEQRMVGKILL